MAEDSYDVIRRAVVEALGAKPSAEQRRKIAADLRSLADQQVRMAERDEAKALEQTSRVVDGSGRNTERQPGFYVRIKHEQDPHLQRIRIRVALGQAIWAAIGNPEWVDIQKVGPNVWIVESKKGAGYEIDTRVGLPACVVDMASPVGQFLPGRYRASLHMGAIVLGEKVA